MGDKLRCGILKTLQFGKIHSWYTIEKTVAIINACHDHALYNEPFGVSRRQELSYLSDIMQVIVDGLSSCETREWSTFVFWTSESFLIIPSLCSRRLEVVGERKKRRVRGRHARDEGTVEKQSAHKFLYTLLLAEVSFRYGFKHLRSFSVSCFP